MDLPQIGGPLEALFTKCFVVNLHSTIKTKKNFSTTSNIVSRDSIFLSLVQMLETYVQNCLTKTLKLVLDQAQLTQKKLWHIHGFHA